MSFASRLKRLREEKGLTQRQLAEAAGLGLSTLTYWEQGIREPTWTALQDLCKALGVDCTAFQTDGGKDDAPTDPSPRGRPVKPTAATSEPEAPKRGRGRPKKTDEK